MLKRTVLAAAVLAAMSGTALAAPPYMVTNGDDNGAGSLREGLSSGASLIVISPAVSTIEIDTTLFYMGDSALTIRGSGQVVDGGMPEDGGFPIFHVTEGASLNISNLEFAGNGGYSIEAQGGSKGIYVQIPDDREGIVSVKLTNVTVRDTGYHGVHITDCQGVDQDEIDGCGAGAGAGDQGGSDASIQLQMTGVLIDGAGFGRQDGDGVRVDDRGPGHIGLAMTNSIIQFVGGDGMELDEGGIGDVMINVRNSLFDNNGNYCDATLDWENLDPACNDDGDPDVDDAFDIDEAGLGKIVGMVANVDLIENFDEGLDFDTQGGGDEDGISVDLKLSDIFGIDNADEAVKVSEEEDGTVLVDMRSLDIGGDVEVEEEDAGDLHVTVNGSWVGDDLKIAQLPSGEGTLKVRGSVIVDDIDITGDVDEI